MAMATSSEGPVSSDFLLRRGEEEAESTRSNGDVIAAVSINHFLKQLSNCNFLGLSWTRYRLSRVGGSVSEFAMAATFAPSWAPYRGPVPRSALNRRTDGGHGIFHETTHGESSKRDIELDMRRTSSHVHPEPPPRIRAVKEMAEWGKSQRGAR